jgi:hypothetical protein
VVVDDFDIGRTLLGPYEADAPLVIDADRMLSAAVTRQGVESVRRRRAQVIETARVMKHVQLPQRLLFDPAESLRETIHP